MPVLTANPWRVLVVHGGIGAAWLLADPSRTDIPAFQPAVSVGHALGLPFWPMRAWGAALLTVAVITAVAMFRKSEPAVEVGCLLLAMIYAFFAVTLAVATFTIPNASFAGGLWALGFAWISLERATPHRRRKG